MYGIMKENKSKGDVVVSYGQVIFNGGKTKDYQRFVSQPVEVKAKIQARYISNAIHVPVDHMADVHHLAADYDIRKLRDSVSSHSNLGNIYGNICSLNDVIDAAIDGRLFGVRI